MISKSCIRWISGVLALLVTLPLRAQSPPDLQGLSEFVRWGGVAASLPLFLGAWVLIRLLESLGESYAQRVPHHRLLVQKAQTISRFLIYLLTLATVTGLSIRLDPTALAVIGGALAFAVGFALRDLVGSFIAGITILFDRPFHVGDRVSYGGEYGDIVKIGLRSVRMNTLDHNVITIPNNKIFTDITSSSNYGELEMQVGMDFYVGLDQDLRRAMEIVREACLSSPYIFLERPLTLSVKQVFLQDLPAYRIKARPYVFDCKYEKRFETDVALRVHEAFRRECILPPALLHRPL